VPQRAARLSHWIAYAERSGSWLYERQAMNVSCRLVVVIFFLDQPREETCSKRQCSVVEIVMRVVHGAAADSAGIANIDKRAGAGFEHVSKVLRRRNGTSVTIDVRLADEISLGFQFSPRLADAGGARLWRIDPKADYSALNPLTGDRVNTKRSCGVLLLHHIYYLSSIVIMTDKPISKLPGFVPRFTSGRNRTKACKANMQKVTSCAAIVVLALLQFITASIPAIARDNRPDPEIIHAIIQESRASDYATGHPCACPDDLALNGSRCSRQGLGLAILDGLKSTSAAESR
jgi:hypothetical protein